MKKILRRIAIAGLMCALAMMGTLISAHPAAAGTLTHGYATSTYYFNKVETRDISTGDFTVAAVCGTLALGNPWVGGACLMSSVSPVTQARRAENRGMCLKAKIVHFPPTIVFDIYGGSKYCR